MSEIRDCLPPDRNPRRPAMVLPKGSIDTHVHVFEPGYPLSAGRGYNPPCSTLDDLKHLHATLGIERVVLARELSKHPALVVASATGRSQPRISCRTSARSPKPNCARNASSC